MPSTGSEKEQIAAHGHMDGRMNGRIKNSQDFESADHKEQLYFHGSKITNCDDHHFYLVNLTFVDKKNCDKKLTSVCKKQDWLRPVSRLQETLFR